MEHQRATGTERIQSTSPADPAIHQAARQTHPFLLLQRQLGNKSVLRTLRSGALQAKLNVSSPGDVYEQEADRVAEAVLGFPETDHSPHSGTEEIIRKSGNPDDNAVASLPSLVTSFSETLLQRECSGCAGGLPCTECEEERTLQPKGGEFSYLSDEPISADLLHEIGPGVALDRDTRNFMESRFRRDFGQVRTHVDSRSAESVQTLGALAFTVGSHIVFGAGQYAPTTIAGQRLLAHELAHVTQQSGPGNRFSSENRRLAMRSKGDPLVNQWRAAILAGDYASALNALKQMNQPARLFLLKNQSFITSETLTRLSDAAGQLGPDFAEVLTAIQEESQRRESHKSETKSTNTFTIKGNQVFTYGQIEGPRLSCTIGASKGDCPIPTGSEITVLKEYRGGDWLLVRFHNEKLAAEWNGKEGIVQIFAKKSDLDADKLLELKPRKEESKAESPAQTPTPSSPPPQPSVGSTPAAPEIVDVYAGAFIGFRALTETLRDEVKATRGRSLVWSQSRVFGLMSHTVDWNPALDYLTGAVSWIEGQLTKGLADAAKTHAITDEASRKAAVASLESELASVGQALRLVGQYLAAIRAAQYALHDAPPFVTGNLGFNDGLVDKTDTMYGLLERVRSAGDIGKLTPSIDAVISSTQSYIDSFFEGLEYGADLLKAARVIGIFTAVIGVGQALAGIATLLAGGFEAGSGALAFAGAGAGTISGGAISAASTAASIHAILQGVAVTSAGGLVAMKTGGLEPVETGKAGEAKAGITGPKEPIPSLTETAEYRVPDKLTEVTLEEVKNVTRLSNTSQLRDFLLYAQQTGRQFVLWMRGPPTKTILSGPLQDLVNQGLIVVKYL